MMLVQDAGFRQEVLKPRLVEPEDARHGIGADINHPLDLVDD